MLTFVGGRGIMYTVEGGGMVNRPPQQNTLQGGQRSYEKTNHYLCNI